ncbi:Cas10/Cmr2 second palm domain-containing protein [Pectinatus haikarae]|uniref:Cas10/Cmr2 second palm domain-containing protein n=1 Tax=Pectinatus haikarae TaxID=349096 RepID=UPI0018C6240D|nr:hypothetical protein [Pectinatus haikarae]
MVNKYVAGLSIDKIQTYLTEAIHAHVQEKQTEEATLKSIVNSSREISDDFFTAIENKFNEHKIEIEKLMSCSGVYIFSCTIAESDEPALEELLNELFLHYYHISQGNKLLHYVFFKNDGRTEIEAIQEAKKRLKQNKYFTRIIEKNKSQCKIEKSDTASAAKPKDHPLFSFCKIEKSDTASAANQKDYPMFVKDINALYQAKDTDSEDTGNSNHFRIAVIKADLDGMGDMFSSIKNYKEYTSTSEVLSDTVSLRGLHKAAKSCRPDNQSYTTGDWLFPFYIAGDDIFFAVSVTNIIKGVDVCQYLLKEIKNKLAEKLLGEISNKISMSIGVEITFNRQPIRYYLDRVEDQLENAKNDKNSSHINSLKPFLNSKISIGGLTFLDIDYAQFKDCKKSTSKERKSDLNSAINSVPIWQFFINDMNLLLFIKNTAACKELLGTPSFFYTLLERLSDEVIRCDDKKYINLLLYYLLPNYLGNTEERLWQAELLLNAAILRQLCRKIPKKGFIIDKSSYAKHRMDTYLRLMLLFSDPRFQIAKNQVSDTVLLSKENIDNARKNLLTKIRHCLYETISHKTLTSCFVKQDKFTIPADNTRAGNKKPRIISYYKTVRVEKSMFFRLRNTEKIPICKAAIMLSMNNNHNDLDNTTASQPDKPSYRMPFDAESFCEKTRSSTDWTPDFIDSLMLFYQYNEAVIKYKIITGNSKNHKDKRSIRYVRHS